MTEESATERDWSEFIPDVDLPPGTLEGGTELLEGYGIVAAYVKWCGKSEPNPGSRTESIMVSCPRPDHPDNNPSAWLNSEKNVWYCGACSEGGDIVDLGAIHFNIDYRAGSPSDFARLLELMLESMGVDVEALKARNADAALAHEAIPVTDTPEAEAEAEAEAGLVNTPAVAVHENEDEDDTEPLAELEIVPLRWEELIDTAPKSFLHGWMAAVSPSDVPNEYLFWLGLQLIGLAIGRDAYLLAGTPVYPNLLISLIGRTGIGKSRSVNFASEVLRQGLPFNHTDPASKGVQLLGRPGSGEALYEMFSWMPDDKHLGTRGLVDIDEMSELMTAANRRGSTLKEAVIGIADNKRAISHRSRAAGSVEVVEPFMALITGGQPDAMANILSSNDTVSGFANRFVFVQGTPKPRPAWTERPIVDLTGLPEKLARVRAWANGAIEIEPTSAAPRFDATLGWLDQVRERPNGDIFARLELHAMKLIAILCANRRTRVADVEIIEQVEHLIETLVPTTGAVAEQITVSGQEYYQHRVLREIERREYNDKEPSTRTNLVKAVTRSRRDKAKTGEAIAYLERVGVIKKGRLKTKPGEPSKTADRWVLAK